MRSVVSHFFNEEYLLPWWLKHHVALFDHGVLIDHGSSDRSADICRELAPHWRLVRSRLTHFDAYLTDFEVMGFEQELPGWKMALNVTEFLLPAQPLDEYQRHLSSLGRQGCAATGMLVVDSAPESPASPERPLALDKHVVVDDNAITEPAARARLGIGHIPFRNRFFHCLPVGMYHPGRHCSFHPDSLFRFTDLFVLHYGFAPWNANTIRRKLQIASKLVPADLQRGWGSQHTKSVDQLTATFQSLLPLAQDLAQFPGGAAALARLPALIA